MYKVYKSLYHLLDVYQHGLYLEIFSVFSRIKISLLFISLSIPVRNKQILNEFKDDDRIGPIIAKFHDISCLTEMPKLINGEFISVKTKK